MYNTVKYSSQQSKAFLANEQSYDTTYDILKRFSISNKEGMSSVKTFRNTSSIFQKLKKSAKFLKSPIFVVQVIIFAIGNCTVSLSLNIVNDLICLGTNAEIGEFNKTQKRFEIVRGVLTTMSCFLMGFATDLSMKFWNKTSSRNKDVQKTFLRMR